MAAQHPDRSPHRTEPGGRFADSRIAKLALIVGAPAVALLVLEAALFAVGFGRNPDFFIPDDRPGVFRTNPRYTELFLPASFGLKPYNFRLTKEKPAGIVRVFVLGESAAMGVPEPGFSIAPQLQAQLRAAHADRRFEVYNLGITAINSHVIRHLAHQAVEFDPDLVVLYMGNNEVVGPYGPASTVTDAVPPLGVIRSSILLRSTRTGQLLERVISAAAGAGGSFREWRGMEMFAGNTVGTDDPRLRQVYDNFSANLNDIIELFQEAGTAVIVSTVAVNIRESAPFASLHDESLSPKQQAEWKRLVREAKEAEVLGETRTARALLEKAAEVDAGYADTHFALARLLDGLGEARPARHHYLEALKLDALRFRADERLNDIVRDSAAASGASLVDAATAMGAGPASTSEPAGQRFFFEHVHLRWEGNHRLSRLLAAECSRALFGGDGSVRRWLDSQACADAVGYTGAGEAMMLMRMDELTTRPPFTSQRTYADDRARLKREIARATERLSSPDVFNRALKTVEAARRRDPGNAFLVFHEASLRSRTGNHAAALALNESLDQLEPLSPERSVQRAYLLQQLGHTGEAEALLLRTARTDPYYFQTYGLLGGLWLHTGQTAQGLEFFEELVGRMPESRGARLTYARLLDQTGNAAAAEEQWQAVLRMFPDEEGALERMVERCFADGREEEGLQLMLRAFDYNPRNYDNNARLVQVHQERGDLQKTAAFMAALARSGPVNAALHLDLARIHLQWQRRREAVVELHKALRQAEIDGDTGLRHEVEQMLAAISERPK